MRAPRRRLKAPALVGPDAANIELVVCGRNAVAAKPFYEQLGYQDIKSPSCCIVLDPPDGSLAAVRLEGALARGKPPDARQPKACGQSPTRLENRVVSIPTPNGLLFLDLEFASGYGPDVLLYLTDIPSLDEEDS